MPSESVAIVDLAQDDKLAAEDLYRALHDIGFAYVVNHGISAESMNRTERLAHEFFSLPNATKCELSKQNFNPQHSNVYRGYYPLAPSNAIDHKELFEIGNDWNENLIPKRSRDRVFFEPNVWPKSRSAKWDQYFRCGLTLGYEEAELVSERMMGLIAIALGLPKNYFEPFFKQNISTFRIIHYPRNDVVISGTQLSCAEHFDSGLLTLLQQDKVGGLQVLNKDDTWIDVPYIENSYVINIGLTLEKWTGKLLRANKHRVVAVNADRYSIPFFYEPNPDVEIGPLPVASEHAADYTTFDPFTYGDFGVANFKKFAEFQHLEKLLQDD